MIYLIAQVAALVAIGIQEVEIVSASDEELSAVHRALRTVLRDELSGEYHYVRMELSVIGQVVLRGQRLVIPHTLRQRTLELAHEGHMGIVKTKEWLR